MGENLLNLSVYLYAPRAGRVPGNLNPENVVGGFISGFSGKIFRVRKGDVFQVLERMVQWVQSGLPPLAVWSHGTFSPMPLLLWEVEQQECVGQ